MEAFFWFKTLKTSLTLQSKSRGTSAPQRFCDTCDEVKRLVVSYIAEPEEFGDESYFGSIVHP